MHGYELRQALERVVGHFLGVSWGSLYPMLKKLEEKGYLSKRVEARDKGPERIVYQITPLGEERLRELLTAGEPVAGSGSRHGFLIKVAFFHLLGPPERLRLLDAHGSALREKLDMLVAEQERVGERTNRYRQALLEYALARVRTDLDWVNALMRIEQEES